MAYSKNYLGQISYFRQIFITYHTSHFFLAIYTL